MLHVLRCKGLIVFLRCTNSVQDHQNQIRDQHDCSHARYREQQSLRRLVMTGKPLDLHNHSRFGGCRGLGTKDLEGKDEATEPGIKRRRASVVPGVGLTPRHASQKFAQCNNESDIRKCQVAIEGREGRIPPAHS
jgi:hypothetical protein